MNHGRTVGSRIAMLIDKMSPLPVYQQIINRFKESIIKREVQPHGKLPSEREMSEQFGVSRMTVRRAIERLVEGGYLVTKGGKGIFVSTPRWDQGVIKIMDFFGDMIDKGLKPESRLLSAKEVRPPKAISEILRVPQDKKVLRIKRILLADQIPFVLEEKYLIHEKCLQLREENFQIAGNSFKFMDRCTKCWVKAEINITARTIDHHDANMLRVSKNTIIFQLTKKVFTFNNSPLSYITSRYRGDLFSFNINVFNYYSNQNSVSV